MSRENMQDMETSTFGVLLEKCFAGDISKREARVLGEMLSSSEEVFLRYLRFVDLHEALESCFAGPVAVRAIEPVHRRGALRFPVPVRWLAAAASILAAAGIIWFLGNISGPAHPQLVGARIMSQTGDIEASGSTLITHKDSFCHVALSDDVTVAMDQASRLRWSPVDTIHIQTLNLEEGRAFVHTAKRERPLRVHAGHLVVDVRGTRFVTDASDLGTVAVLDGNIWATAHFSGARVGSGQIAFALITKDSAPTCYLRVMPYPGSRQQLEWLAQTGLPDSSEVLARLPSAQPTVPSDGPIDLTRYTIKGGTWDIQPEDPNAPVRRTDTLSRGIILFDGPKWKRGTVSCQFRVIKKTMPRNASAGIQFYYDQYWSEGFHVNVDDPRLSSGWVQVRLEFEAQEDSGMIARKCEFWSLTDRSAVGSRNNWQLGIKIPVRRGSKAGIGLTSTHCSAEFRNISITGEQAEE